MTAKESDEEKSTGASRSFYLDPEVSEKIDEWAKKLDRRPSWIANKLLKQALVRPKWTWCGVVEDDK
jgi:predicted transcriptional regulator